MNVAVPVAWEGFVQQQIQAKQYKDVNELIEAALQALQARTDENARHLDELRRAADIGFEQIERGDYIAGKDVTVEMIRQGALKRFGPPTRKRT